MRLFATVALEVAPVSVVWIEGEDLKARIFRDAQEGITFFVENNLAGNAGQIFAENGEPIQPPTS